MAPAPSHPAAQDGFTLVELLVAATLMLLIVTASLTALVGLDRGQREVASRTDELSRARQGVERMTREIRQARVIASADAANLSLITPVHLNGSATPTWRKVAYACQTATPPGSCSRTVYQAAGSAPALTDSVVASTQLVVPNITSASVFSLRKDGAAVTYGTVGANFVAFSVTMKVRNAASGQGTVNLADGVDLRNAPAT